MTILDPTWKYTPASETAKPGYLARRFKEIRARQKREIEDRERIEAEASTKIAALPQRAAK